MGIRPANRYELLTCAWKGHALVGTVAASVDGADPALVREQGGVRWHRCLRCDDWIARLPPVEPTRPTVPGRDEIAVPARGPALRDRYILRLIALDRAVHVALLTGLAVFIFLFLGHRHGLQRDYDEIMQSITGGPNKADTVHNLLGDVGHLFIIKPSHLYDLGIFAICYGALETTEMVGLWFAKRWAEYLTFLATCVFVPIEVYELAGGFGWLKTVALVINLAIAAYLLFAKRLFGVCGGHAQERERRRLGSGWHAVDAATVAGLPDSLAASGGSDRVAET